MTAGYPPPDPATATYTCPWCHTVISGATTSCPACGAAVNVRARATDSGWVELPAIPDMARIQFGRSSCQIAGTSYRAST